MASRAKPRTLTNVGSVTSGQRRSSATPTRFAATPSKRAQTAAPVSVRRATSTAARNAAISALLRKSTKVPRTSSSGSPLLLPRCRQSCNDSRSSTTRSVCVVVSIRRISGARRRRGKSWAASPSAAPITAVTPALGSTWRKGLSARAKCQRACS